jgi:Uma2 family endonuclease
MGAAAEKLKLTYAEYLALERETGVRYEFVDGDVYAMAGGSLAHARVTAAAIAELSFLLRPGRGRCRVYSPDGKIHVLVGGKSYYPDASVVCGPVVSAPIDAHAITNPSLIVEVLSPDTERNDRGSKFTAYQSIPSLRHYLLVSQDEHRVEHYERVREGQWTLSIYGPGASVTLADLGGAVEVDALYAGEDQERPDGVA